MGKKQSKPKKPKVPEDKFPENDPSVSAGESSRSVTKVPKQEAAHMHEEFDSDNEHGENHEIFKQLAAELEGKEASKQEQPSTAKLVRQSPVEEPESTQN